MQLAIRMDRVSSSKFKQESEALYETVFKHPKMSTYECLRQHKNNDSFG